MHHGGVWRPPDDGPRVRRPSGGRPSDETPLRRRRATVARGTDDRSPSRRCPSRRRAGGRSEYPLPQGALEAAAGHCPSTVAKLAGLVNLGCIPNFIEKFIAPTRRAPGRRQRPPRVSSPIPSAPSTQLPMSIGVPAVLTIGTGGVPQRRGGAGDEAPANGGRNYGVAGVRAAYTSPTGLSWPCTPTPLRSRAWWVQPAAPARPSSETAPRGAASRNLVTCSAAGPGTTS